MGAGRGQQNTYDRKRCGCLCAEWRKRFHCRGQSIFRITGGRCKREDERICLDKTNTPSLGESDGKKMIINLAANNRKAIDPLNSSSSSIPGSPNLSVHNNSHFP